MGARAAQALVALAPGEARQVGPRAALLETEGGHLLIQGWATHSWTSGDQAVRRPAAVQLLQSGASKVAEKVAGQILALNREGKNQRQIADLVGLSVTTVRPLLGLMEAERVFTEGAELPLLGRLLALPALAATGLLEEASGLFGQLRNGSYGLRASLLTFIFLAPDRPLEVKTFSRKLAEMGGLKLGSRLTERLAHRRPQEHPDAMGYLDIDGHARVYNGKRALPKVHSTGRHDDQDTLPGPPPGSARCAWPQFAPSRPAVFR